MSGDPSGDPVLRAKLLEYLRLRPCHLTGEHNPRHTTDYICREQADVLIKELLAAAGLRFDQVPRELHGEDCYWCHQVPAQEEYRERSRRLHAWAGAPISEELAALAEDGVHPGDEETLEAAVRELEPGKWHAWDEVHQWASQALYGEVVDVYSLRATRAARLRERLITRGLLDVERGPGGVRFRRPPTSEGK